MIYSPVVCLAEVAAFEVRIAEGGCSDSFALTISGAIIPTLRALPARAQSRKSVSHVWRICVFLVPPSCSLWIGWMAQRSLP